MRKDQDRSVYKKAVIRFFISFQFTAACSLLLFCAALYFVIHSLVSQPEVSRGVVWEDQFNAANLDTQFATISDHYDVNFSLWQPVPPKLRGTAVSTVRQIVRRQVVRKEGQDEYLLAMHTSGLKPDFSCLSHPFSFTKDYGLVKTQGAEHLSRFTARVDISEEPVGQPIDVSFIIHSWNAFQGEKNRVFGAYAKPGTQRLSFHFAMPEVLNRFTFSFQRIDAVENKTIDMTPEQVNYRVAGPKEFSVSVTKPRTGDVYFVRWRPKKRY